MKMDKLQIIISMLTTMLAFYLYQKLNSSIKSLSNVTTCPYCYGTDFCDSLNVNTTALNSDSFSNMFMNCAGSKNVFKANTNNRDIVLKKLANDDELAHFDKTINRDQEDGDFSKLNLKMSRQELLKVVLKTNPGEVNSLKVCSVQVATSFLNDVFKFERYSGIDNQVLLKNIWTILMINPEPLILQLLDSNDDNRFPVPEYLGACGRLIAVTDAGDRLGDLGERPWALRASYALQLLNAAHALTDGHDTYRFYLTDVSPDNIVVDDKGVLSVVDLENVILALKNTGSTTFHNSVNFESDGFAYSEDDICSHSISDHNYYAICKLLLSQQAPWPMIEGGLLHSPPNEIDNNIFNLIEECVEPKNSSRIDIVNKLIKILRLT